MDTRHRSASRAIEPRAGLWTLPAGYLENGETIVDGARQTAEVFRTGQVVIPPPPESVSGWPLIGEKLAAFWALASSNLTEALEQLQPQIRAISKWLLGAAAGAGLGLLKFVASIIIAGILLPGAEKSARVSERFFRRLAGEGGAHFGSLTTSTVRSVARGILGVAIIQATLAGIGLVTVGVPAAGLLTVVILVLCIIQLGPGLILIPTAIWLFAAGDSQLTAILFTIYIIPVILVDNFLKPILLGRGVDVPMLVMTGGGDEVTDPDRAATFVEGLGDLGRFVRFEQAAHADLWNVDADRYERTVRDWLTEILGAA